MGRKCYLYWIRRSKHTDMKNEGYVGITFYPHARFVSHKGAAKSLNKLKIHKMLNRYDDIQFDVLCVGERDYIADLEYKLRPAPNIGYNMMTGGILRGPCGSEIISRVAHKIAKVSKMDIVKFLIDYHFRGLNYSQIGKKYGFCKACVNRHINNETLLYPELRDFRDWIETFHVFHPWNLKDLDEKIYNSILEDKESGFTYQDLHEKYGISVMSLQRICYGTLDMLKKFKSYRSIKENPLMLTYSNKTQTLEKWSKELGLNRKTLWNRHYEGYSVPDILSPNRWEMPKAKKYTYNNKTMGLKGWSDETGIPKNTLHHRLKVGWPLEKALTTKVCSSNSAIGYKNAS